MAWVVGVGAGAGAWLWRRRADATPPTWSPPAGRHVEGALAARVVGQGAPRTVLLHGMFNSGRYWGASYDELSEEGGLVVPDLLGFGRSPRPPSGYSADAHADALAATLRQLGAVQPLVVGTHSVGTVVALRLALRHPDLVGSITAFAPPLYASRHDAEERISGTDPLARLFLFNEALSERACALMCEHRDAATVLVRAARPRLPRELARDRVEHSWSSYSETLSNLVLTSQASGWLDQIDVPVQLIAGDLDDALDLSWLEALEGRHPRVALHVVPGGGHDLPLTHGDLCIAALQRALTPPAVLNDLDGTETVS